MPSWLQHVLVFALVAGCLWFACRDVLHALGIWAGKATGCGSCKSCAADVAPKAAEDGAPKPAPVVFISADALTARLAQRRQN